MRIGYVFGGRYDAVALGGNAVDIREDVDGARALGHEVEFRAYEQAPLAVAPQVRAAKSRIPRRAWDTARDVALLRKNRAWRQRLLDDGSLAGSELVLEYWSPDSFGAVALAKQLRVPFVIENLDPNSDDRRAESPSLLRDTLVRAERERRRAASALIVMSRAMGQYLVDHDGVEPERVHWLPQGVNAELFRPPAAAEREAARRRLGANGDYLVGFVGSMASYQRVDMLIEAGRLLAGRRRDLRIVLVGGTPERARAAGAGDDVTVISHVDYADVPSLVGAFDVAVLPDSNWYGSPVKVLEYAAVGIPLVAPDVDPVRDLVSAPDEGLLVPPGDPVALADAIAAALEDRGAALERARRLRAKVLADFDRGDRTRRLLELCGRLVDEQR
jgi:glycosyltransferase involved in cell wall biosynthesis